MRHLYITLKIWIQTSMFLAFGIATYLLYVSSDFALIALFATALVAAIASIPAIPVLTLALKLLEKTETSTWQKTVILLSVQLFICLAYGLLGKIVLSESVSFFTIATACLFACSAIATIINKRELEERLTSAETIEYFSSSTSSTEKMIHENIYQNKTNTHMSTNTPSETYRTEPLSNGNKIFIKGLITGGLILLMLIPTIFIMNLIEEREKRNEEVVAEVSNKWATAQTVTGPYLLIPYTETFTQGKEKVTVKKQLVLLPEQLNVNGQLIPEERKRSIYTVLLYRSNLTANGKFQVKDFGDIPKENLRLDEAKLCLGISDFKGVEEMVVANVNGTNHDLTPYVPNNTIDKQGLSASIPLVWNDFEKEITFNVNLKLKGSQQLSFVPLSGNSRFTLKSSWPNPSFDGNALPTERTVTNSGFAATWNFNKASLPFTTVLKDAKFDTQAFAFGVSMVQPADQYAKTMRSVKYAILFIGLTFSLFFIIELMQKKPFHPVQYILVGIALVIFYTLLLAISEYVNFDFAYMIAAAATIALITLYAKGHFNKWSVAGVFAGVLSLLYSFIFVLIRLEDTALLVGSIGLFIVLALVMYASRKINWYNPTLPSPTVQ